MSESMFVSHCVYLTPEERKILAKEPTTIETFGISVPMHTKEFDKALTEVFVKYLISTEIEGSNQIELMSDGYKISFPDFNNCQSIRDINEGCSDWLMLNVMNKINDVVVHHQVIFKDVSHLERTTVCSQLSGFLKSQKK